MAATLSVTGLRVTYPGPPPVRAVDDLTFTVAPGECLGILGESGSGKSSLALSLLGLHSDALVEGQATLGDIDLRALDEAGWREVRWQRIALSFQSSTSLNPALRVRRQLTEPLEVHLGMGSGAAKERADELLERVGLGPWAAGRYPAELSGGQRRLVLLAMALACDPDVLILDEPTAGLDGISRTGVIRVLREAQAAGQGLIVLGHDADALEALATQVAVIYRGWLAELGPTDEVLGRPQHPYSWALLNSRPTLASLKELRGVRGDPPDPTAVAPGCPFAGRCTQEVAECADGRPAFVPAAGVGPSLVACIRSGLVRILSARGLTKTYRSGHLGARTSVVAADGIDLDVVGPEVVGLVGPTGAGKSTLASLLTRLLEPDAGSLEFEGADLLALRGDALKATRRRLQMLFQDPFEALSPRLRVQAILEEPMAVQHLCPPDQYQARARAALREVRLPSTDEFLSRFTHEMSGGQLQRLALARALLLEPDLLVADEPVSMLDPSEQAKVLQLLKQLQVERGMAMVLVSHDLATVLRVADRVLILDQGRVVEEGTGAALLRHPQHPVTRGLLEAAGVSFDGAGSGRSAGAQLAGTQLAGTQLAGTQLAGAQLAGTQLAGASPAAAPGVAVE